MDHRSVVSTSLCDVHVIVTEGDREDWLQQCLASLEAEPVTVHMIEGTKGHIGKGRAAGFSAGSSPYVSFVDPDDYVFPGAFERAISHLEQHPEASAVCSGERLIDEDSNVLRDTVYGEIHDEMVPATFLLYIHHLLVLRRSAITPYLNFMAGIANYCEFCTWGEMMYDGHMFDHIPTVDYAWRQRIGSAKRTIPVDDQHMTRLSRKRIAIRDRS